MRLHRDCTGAGVACTGAGAAQGLLLGLNWVAQGLLGLNWPAQGLLRLNWRRGWSGSVGAGDCSTEAGGCARAEVGQRRGCGTATQGLLLDCSTGVGKLQHKGYCWTTVQELGPAQGLRWGSVGL